MTFNNEPLEFEIVKNVAVLSTEKRSGWTKELNLISFNDAAPKYDLRSWDPNHVKMSKGVTLSKDEMRKLKKAIEDLEI